MLGFNTLEAGNTIFENNAFSQALDHGFIHFTVNTRHVLALHFIGRVH